MDDNDQQPPKHVKFSIAATTSSKLSSLSSTTTTTAPAVGGNSDSSVDYCLKCKVSPILFECDPCGCPSFCMDCAKKLASGGRCKTCKKFYGGLRKIRI
jgi:hypothetical protein